MGRLKNPPQVKILILRSCEIVRLISLRSKHLEEVLFSIVPLSKVMTHDIIWNNRLATSLPNCEGIDDERSKTKKSILDASQSKHGTVVVDTPV